MIRNDVGVIIPARFNSSRFPGKPLTLINGEPMLLHVYRRIRKVAEENQIYVATDSQLISDFCKKSRIRSIMTSEKCLTGTDRVAEANSKLDFEIVVNVQGDEPVINPNDIAKAIDQKYLNFNCVINGFSSFVVNENSLDNSIPKIVMKEDSTLIYASRTNVPALHGNTKMKSRQLSRQICIYVYDRRQLEAFHSYGRKSVLESQEDIEILRFLELEIPVKMIEMESTIAVDYPIDIVKVENFISLRTKEYSETPPKI